VKTIADAETAPPGPSAEHPRRRHHRWRYLFLAVAAVALVAFAYPSVRYMLRSHPKAKSVSSAIEQFRDATSIPQSATKAFLRPAAGVYSATGQGSEHISFPPNSQHDGSTMPVTVRHLTNGCWTWRIDFNTAHWQEYTFCPSNAQLLLVAQRNFQSWDFGATKIDNLAQYTCSPARPRCWSARARCSRPWGA